MRQSIRKLCFVPTIAAVFAVLLPLASWAQTAPAQKQDRWLHVRVESSQAKG